MINTTGAKKYLPGLLCLACLSAFGQSKSKRVRDSIAYAHGIDSLVKTLGPPSHQDSARIMEAFTELSKYRRPEIAINREMETKNQLTLELNPGLLFMEQGLSLQYNNTYNFGILLGGGYNEDNSGNAAFHTYDGSGYTIRAGILQYLDPAQKWYFSFQGFYRYYGNLNAVAQDAQGFTKGIDDQVINPLRQNLNNVAAGDGDQVDVYHAKAKIICVDAVWGYQLRKRHFVLDMFGGFGSREKEIYLLEVGYYVNAMAISGMKYRLLT